MTIKNEAEYLVKYEEYMKLLVVLNLAQNYAENTRQNCDASDLESRLNELKIELDEYKRTNLL